MMDDLPCTEAVRDKGLGTGALPVFPPLLPHSSRIDE